jgi:hypothetical protein
MDAMSNLIENAIQTGEKYYWPGSALDDFSSDCEDSTIGFEDEDAATGG